MNILVSYNWLKHYAAIKDSPEDLAHKLSLSGPSVEKINHIKPQFGEDYIFDAEITTNRPDALGMVGFAREASAITGAKFFPPKRKHARIIKSKDENKFSLSVKIEDKNSCPRYMAAMMTNIKVEDSPLWFKKRLINAGLRPINNIVDVANYAMLEFGQPLHAFDADKISGGARKEIIVRKAKNSEEIETIDGVNRKLTTDNLIIADIQKPIAIAGLMGGANSAVNKNTKTIILEAANFDAKIIRRSARMLNLFSDSSNRFEKGLSTEFPKIALFQAIELISDIAGGGQFGKITDVYLKKYRPRKVGLEFSYLCQKLGIKIAPKKVIKILESLGFRMISRSKKALKAEVPHWRQNDIEISEDLIEEIARIYGYHNLPSTLPKGEIPDKASQNYFAKEERVKDFLSDSGFCEIYSNSMISEKMLKSLAFESSKALKIKNPLNEDMVYMRTTLIPSLLKIISQNLRHGKKVSIFELANVYSVAAKEKNRLPEEKMILTMAICLPLGGAFEKLRAVSESLFKKLGIKDQDIAFTPVVRENLHPTRTAALKISGAEIGVIGEIHPLALKTFDIGQRTAVSEINFEKLRMAVSDKKIYSPFSKFPSVEIDLAVVLDKKINWSDVQKEVSNINPLIVGVELFDVYEGKNILSGKKSLAFHIVFQSMARTLEDEEIRQATGQIIEKLKNKFGASLRK